MAKRSTSLEAARPSSEIETIFRWAADEPALSIYTGAASIARRIEAKGYAPYKLAKVRGKVTGWFYRVPRAEFRWRVGHKKRVVSDAQREAARRLRGKIPHVHSRGADRSGELDGAQ
jgi:hypothetical protein